MIDAGSKIVQKNIYSFDYSLYQNRKNAELSQCIFKGDTVKRFIEVDQQQQTFFLSSAHRRISKVLQIQSSMYLPLTNPDWSS